MTDASALEQARQRRRSRRALLRQAHPDLGGSAQAFCDVVARLGPIQGSAVHVHVWRRRHGLLGLADDLQRARTRRTQPARVR